MAEQFDVAFSFSNKDRWVVKDLFTLFRRLGFSSYSSADLPDQANGQLRKRLLDIYRSSKVNFMIYSSDYESKKKDSVVAMERKILFDRHIGKSDIESLFVLIIDDSKVPEEFDMCLVHRLTDCGLIGVEGFVSKRLKSLTTVKADTGFVYDHPEGSEHKRGNMRPCVFTIPDNWKDGERWLELGDIKVEADDKVSNGMKVYLIPSAACIGFLGHSNQLKSDPKNLEIKKSAGANFVREWKNKRLSGVVFNMNHYGMDYPTVYCSEYDKYLNESWQAVNV